MIPDQGAEYDDVAPNASAMIESMRAYGYTLATAISDLIDNSIAAKASSIWVDSYWSGEQSWITITDDGEGMEESTLVNAMRLGSQSPLENRSETDLGRFGLGLKTASLSQCRRLTVVSKCRIGHVSTRRWDLDHLARSDVEGWQLLRSVHAESTAQVDRINSLASGTAVVWERLDRVVHNADKNDAALKRHFLRSIDAVEGHLAMVFHRFLQPPHQKLRIFVDGRPIAAWDPYADSHPATTQTPLERIVLPDHARPILVKGFVLPHKDMIGDDMHACLSGPSGWNAQQGFYLYRNERLIVAGSWLGLGGTRPWTQEEHYKLARIRLDVPNSMDHQWHLDVKKSHATPPPIISERLQGLAQDVRSSARAVFAHRGAYGKRAKRFDYVRAWKTVQRAGRPVYTVDRQHPLVDAVLCDLEPTQKEPVEAMLRVIEETVPVQQIWLDLAETPDYAATPFHGVTSRQRLSVIRSAYRLLRRVRLIGHREAVEVLSSLDGFTDDDAVAILEALSDGDEQ